MHKNVFPVFFALILTSTSSANTDCKLLYTSQKQIENLKSSNQDIRSFSKSVNKILKSTYDFVNKVDKATLGLASAIATKGKMSFEDVKPTEWDKLNIVGNVIYQQSAFAGAPLRGVKLTFTEGTNSTTITTGANGEFAEFFSKIVPYTRLRLFPAPIFEVRQESIPTMKIPITVKLESKFCTAQTTIYEVPIEPITFIAISSEK